MYKTLISSASVLAFLAAGAQAQEAVEAEAGVTQLQQITVTANRTPTDKSKTGSKVEQVTKAEIDQKSYISIVDYLTRLPGVTSAASGGLGNTTGIYVRGLGGAYVKTLFNGVDISDVTGPQVLSHYQYLQTGGITHLEVLKGSQGTLYGSSAIAGLVDISTIGGVDDGIDHSLHVEGGSFGTVRAHYGVNAAKDGSRIAANVSGLHTDGYSAKAGGDERDGYRNATLDLAFEHRISETLAVFGSLLHADAKAEYDGFSGANDVESYELAKITAGRVGFSADLFDGRSKNSFSFQGFNSDRENVSGGSRYPYSGSRQKFDYQGSFELSEQFILQYGLDHERQNARKGGSNNALGKIDVTGLWTQGVFEVWDDFVLTASVRHDQHSMFGGHQTWRGTASYLFDETNTRLHSSFGTGYRAPSLYELFSDGGDSSLQPERSNSFDVGIEQQFLGGIFVGDLTYFQLEVDDRIFWVDDSSLPSYGYYSQGPGKAQSNGVEVSLVYGPTEWLQLAGSYTYTNARTAEGTRIARVPKHTILMSADAQLGERWRVSGEIKYAADNVDVVYPSTLVDMDDYVILNAKVSYQFSDQAEVYLRGENLLNQKYQVVKDYNTAGISAFLGLKAKF
jgi:vitamin B12 transporter